MKHPITADDLGIAQEEPAPAPIPEGKVVGLNEPQADTSSQRSMLLWHAPCEVPVITAEHAQKWNGLHVVYPDGHAEPIPGELLVEMQGSGPCLWIDHEIHPELLLIAAAHYHGEADPIALEVAAGRWVFAGHAQVPPLLNYPPEND